MNPCGNRERNRFSVYKKNGGISFVGNLFFNCLPFAIGWFIVSIVVHSSDGMPLRGSRPHVGIEILKGVKPPLTDFNTPSSIIHKLRILYIGASLLHGIPNFAFRAFCHSVSSEESSSACFSVVPLKASTGFGVSSFHGNSPHMTHVSTIAFALPNRASAFVSTHALYNQKTTKPLSSEIIKSSERTTTSAGKSFLKKEIGCGYKPFDSTGTFTLPVRGSRFRGSSSKGNGGPIGEFSSCEVLESLAFIDRRDFRDNPFLGFIHSDNMLSSSEGRSAPTDGLCVFHFSQLKKGVKPC